MHFLLLLLLLTAPLTRGDGDADTLLRGQGNNPAEKVGALLDSAWALRSNNPVRAMAFANAALLLAKQSGNKPAEANAYNFQGVIFANTGAYNSAKSAFTKALQAAAACHDSVQLGHAYNNLADVMMSTDDYAAAMQNTGVAVRIFTAIGNNRGLTYTDITLGRLLARQAKYSECLVYFTRALERARLAADTRLYARILLDIANVHLQMRDYEKALAVYEELNNTYTRQHYRKGLAETWTGIAQLYLNKKDFPKAIEFARRSLVTDRQIDNPEGVTRNLNLLALIYLETGNLPEAMKALGQALLTADSLNNGSLLLEVYRTRYLLYEKQGDYTNALRYYKIFESVNDSLFRIKQETRFTDLDAQLAVERALNEKQTLELQLQAQQSQRYYLIGIAVFLLALTGGSLYRYYGKKKANARLEKVNAAKDLLFNIIAHDLKSPFHAMMSAIDILKSEFDELSEEEKHQFIDMLSDASESFSGLLENLLTWSKAQRGGFTVTRERVALHPLLEDLRRLLKNSLKDKAITLESNYADGFFVLADENMFKTVLRNVISNSVKFLPVGGAITVTGSSTNGSSRVVIEDNGPGIKREAIPLLFELGRNMVGRDANGLKSSGLGLIICRDFVTAQGGTFTVESEEGKYTRIIIELPES